MPKVYSSRDEARLMNQWVVSKEKLPDELQWSEDITRLQQMFLKYVMKVQGEGGEAHCICMGILSFLDEVVQQRLYADCEWMIRVLRTCSFLGDISLFLYFETYRKKQGNVKCFIRELQMFRDYGENERCKVVELLLGVMGNSLLYEMGMAYTPSYISVIQERFNMYYYYRQALSKVLCSGENRDRVYIEASSGDFHNAMWHPVFIRLWGDETGGYVFKPRDMCADLAISDMIRRFEEGLLECGIDLPIPELFTHDDDRIKAIFPASENLADQFQTGCGYMKLYKQVEVMDVAVAENSFRKLGALIFIGVLCGVADLHNENIMMTEQGPIIIDGECAFQYGFLVQNHLDEGGLNLLLNGFHSFYENQCWNGSGENNIFPIVSGAEDIYGRLRACMLDGVCEAQNILSSMNLVELGEEFMNKVSNLYVRYVPISTHEFGGRIRSYLCFKGQGNWEVCLNIVRDVVGEFLVETFKTFRIDINQEDLQRAVEQWRSANSEKESDDAFRAAVYKSTEREITHEVLGFFVYRIEADFNRGIIPIFRYCIATGAVYLDDCMGMPVFTSGITLETYYNIFQQHVKWMKSEEFMEEMERRIKKECNK